MEAINYTSGFLWLCTWPVIIYVSYRFIALNIDHFEAYLKEK
ncbi:hypothetical protein [Sulfurospirillum diekertiae]|jgi:hypothetical protein|nr:hypothetical protein [Sulfurospirillum diekertiae]